MDDSWKRAYDERLKEWKADNAARREQSEKTRGEWEKRRSQDLEASYSMPPSAAHSSMASSFVDARDLVTGEGEGGHGTRALDVIPPNAQNQRRGTASGSGEDNSQGWENVPSDSLTSSYPSINFPPLEGDATNDPSRSRRHQHDSSHREGPVLALPSVAPPSVTLSVFDSSLSRRARLLALASSLAINLLLPFINGVMLGFGEIAAKSIFNWGGWSSVAGALGLGSGSSRSRTMATSPRTKGKGAPILLTLQ
ncbi:hypothetical protein CPB86DRAFT_392705 [Serendipita vermifera]|nr:hypothetical protein CPB86DRAFT_392705 [Serendipita vermifera]